MMVRSGQLNKTNTEACQIKDQLIQADRERQTLNKELMYKDNIGESDMTLFYGLKSLLEINSLTVSTVDN